MRVALNMNSLLLLKVEAPRLEAWEVCLELCTDLPERCAEAHSHPVSKAQEIPPDARAGLTQVRSHFDAETSRQEDHRQAIPFP